jgi:excisionase family DNA binding protein
MDEAIELITVAAAAELLKCSRAKIYDLHNAGVIDLRKIGHRSTRVTRDSVDRLIADPSLLKPRLLPERTEKHRRLRVPEAADYIGISPDTLYRLRATGDGPPFIRIGHVLLYDTRELDAWLAARTHRSITAQQHKEAQG